MEFCSRGGLLDVRPKSHSPTLLRNRENHEFISMDNIQLIQGLLGEAQKQNNEGLD